MNREINWDRLSKANYFDRDELFSAMKSVEPDLTESNFKARLQKLLQSEEIGRAVMPIVFAKKTCAFIRMNIVS